MVNFKFNIGQHVEFVMHEDHDAYDDYAGLHGIVVDREHLDGQNINVYYLRLVPSRTVTSGAEPILRRYVEPWVGSSM